MNAPSLFKLELYSLVFLFMILGDPMSISFSLGMLAVAFDAFFFRSFLKRLSTLRWALIVYEFKRSTAELI